MYLRFLNSLHLMAPLIGLSKLKNYFVKKQYEDRMATFKDH